MKIAKGILMPNCILAEGCVWNRNENSLYFVDIEGCAVYRWRPLGKQLEWSQGQGDAMDVIQTSQRVGCLVFHKKGGIVTAESNCLLYRESLESPELPGSPQRMQPRKRWNQTAGKTLAVQSFPDYLRYNDGKCDRYGNLWVGTMAVTQSHPAAKGGGSLYCIRDGEVVAEYGGYTIPNGMAWSRDGSIFYHIDTALQRVDAYDVENETGLVNRRTILTVPEEEGSPDGMCMDEEGNLWIAMWGGSRVNGYRISSDGITRGRKIEEIQVPDRYVSCCCFGGERGHELYITTARDEKGCGGQIYRAEMAVCGAEVYEYGGEDDGA